MMVGEKLMLQDKVPQESSLSPPQGATLLKHLLPLLNL